jgi:hydroxyethylthiazole kinase-like uncharacterized protein yjeF
MTESVDESLDEPLRGVPAVPNESLNQAVAGSRGASDLTHAPSWPLYTVAQLRTLEGTAQAALAPHALMARAGEAAAQVLGAHLARAGGAGARGVWLAAGPGNNGGDALVVAANLRRRGLDVDVCLPVEPHAGDALWALQMAREAGVNVTEELPGTLDGYAAAVDGMFGIGLSRPLAGPFAALAGLINHFGECGAPVLALDVPSGLDSDTGTVVGGGEAVCATVTATFLGAKPGLFTASGRDLAGTVELCTLEIEAARALPTEVAMLNAPHWFAAQLPRREHASNKGSFGSLAVIGGAAGMCGAPILAARAALFTGAGKVHVGFLGDDAPLYDVPHPELMLHLAHQLDMNLMSAVVVGPGMGSSERASAVLSALLQHAVPKVVDADALNLISRHGNLGGLLRRDLHSIITPHPLEAARLLGTDVAAVQHDRPGAARALVDQFKCVAVLKGSGTIIAAPDGRLMVNPSGNAALATGGTGDVLGGIIGAFLAQGMAPFEAALAGVYLHGLAADRLRDAGCGPAGLSASELAPMVRTLHNCLASQTRAARG